jgi:hypothetical protein
MSNRTAANNFAAVRRLVVSVLKQPEAGPGTLPTKIQKIDADEKQLDVLLKINYSGCQTTDL